MRIAVFLPNWVGDAVMATPALAAIRKRFPEAALTGILRPYVEDVLESSGLLDHVISWNPRGGAPAERGWRLAHRLRQERFDVAVVMPNSLRSAWMAWLSGAKRRIGLARNGRQMLLTDPVRGPDRRVPHPALDNYLLLAEALGAETGNRQMRLGTSVDDQQAWDEAKRRLQSVSPVCLAPKSYISLNPGGAFGAAKHWPAAHFGTLARHIVEDLGLSVVVVCGPAERDEARAIVEHAATPGVVSLAEEKPSLGLTKAVIRESAALVTTDSGPRHFAAPFGIPTVTVFGPTHIAWSETHDPFAVHVQRDVDCGPCQQRVCPLGHHGCMTELKPSLVLIALQSLLRRVEAA